MQDLIRITSSALSRLVCVWVFKRGLFTVCQVWEASSSRASGLYTCIFKDFLFTAAKEDYNTWRQLSHHLKGSCSAGARLLEVCGLKSTIFAHGCLLLLSGCFEPTSLGEWWTNQGYYSFKCSIYFSGGPLSALTCCVNARLLSAIKKISPLIYSQSWDGSWVYTTQAMMTFTLIF